MPRPASEVQKKLIDRVELLVLFVGKFKNVEEAIKQGYEDVYGPIVEWLYDHDAITSEEHDSLWGESDGDE